MPILVFLRLSFYRPRPDVRYRQTSDRRQVALSLFILHFTYFQEMYFVFCIYRKAVYRAANALFGKIGLIVSEDVILQLLQSTHIYNTLLYGVDIKTLRVFRQN